MGKLKVIRSSPLATIQDHGRFGFRRYGIPQSGAIDPEGMQLANQLVGNDATAPLIEFAAGGLVLKVVEPSLIGVFGAGIRVNGTPMRVNALAVEAEDEIELSPPQLRYAYLAMGGRLQGESFFHSLSTYLPGQFGGYEGRSLEKGDVLQTEGNGKLQWVASRNAPDHIIHFMKGPEWDSIVPFHSMGFRVDPASNRMGIRLIGKPIEVNLSEIQSSAVIPGTIQLPPNGQPIVLMNDCQTTGGYPRIGKVIDKDLGKLGQAGVHTTIQLRLKQ